MQERIRELLREEVDRQSTQHIFIASENFTSGEVRKLSGSVFTNKYAEGYPGNRYYNGCGHYDEIETLAIDNAKKIFGTNFANVQPHSGANANLAIFLAFLKPGDTILSMNLDAGGHLSHGSPANISGKWFNVISYGVGEDGWIDYDEVHRLADEHKPKLIIAGASAYPRDISWLSFSIAADNVGAYLLADVAHYSGLIVGGVYPSPVGYADFITTTTHKTLRGPRGGLIVWNDEKYTKRINSAVFPGTQGGPLMNQVAAKAQAFYEAAQPDFVQYTIDVVDHARSMCEVFRSNDIKIVTDGTDSHIILLDLRDKKHTGKVVADALELGYGIIVNKNAVPGDTRNYLETSGIRLGTAAMTSCFPGKLYFTDIAHTISDVINS